VEPLSERILSELRRPIDVGGTSIYPTASIGAALFPASGTSSDGLLSAADAALYVAKENGRNGFSVHGIELKRRLLRKLKVEEQIRRAVEQKLFCLHFQPQVSLETDFLGAEALLRWAPSQDATVEISELMLMLEETGLILELGPWIVERACKQLRQWRDDGCWVNRMAINVSSRQVLGPGFMTQLRRATQAAGLQPSDVELELAENALQRETSALREVLAQLGSDGYRLALDDFGSGYCSLAYLKNLSITTLKIDKRFVRSIATDAYDRNLASGIIRLITQLGLEAVAVGVETPEQLDLLSAEGCSIVQGFLIGAPMAADEFAVQAQRLVFGLQDDLHPPSNLVSRRVARARSSRAPSAVRRSADADR
jgi:EAL domain-containing protein (putative c-di-GMP-specific phosphodiesterase class I)